ncbi:MAG: hypothetical protein V1722_03610 [Candidatus Micrarchaeota archaeon]
MLGSVNAVFIQVSPPAGVPVTIFEITAEPTDSHGGTLSVDIFRRQSESSNSVFRRSRGISKPVFVQRINLYDDGLKGDERARDGKYIGVWDSIAQREGNYFVKLCENNKCTERDFVISNGCRLVNERDGIKKNAINVVFTFVNVDDRQIPVSGVDNNRIVLGVEEYNEFAMPLVDASNYGLLSVEPFKSTSNKFNFFYVNIPGHVSGFEAGETKSGREATQAITTLASSCPFENKIPIGLIGWKFRSRVSGGITFLSVDDYDDLVRLTKVYVHESGHSVGNIHDQYIVGDADMTRSNYDEFSEKLKKVCYYPDSPNKYIAVQQCLTNAPWRDLVGNGCGVDGVLDCLRARDPLFDVEVRCYNEIGCIAPNILTNTANNIMARQFEVNDLSWGRGFGQVNERLLCLEIIRRTGSVNSGSVCNTLCLPSCSSGKKCIEGRCT